MYFITFILWAPVAAFFSTGEQGFDMARFLFIMAFPMGMHLAINFFNKKSTTKQNNFYYRMRDEPVEYTGLTPEIKRAVDYIRRENAQVFNNLLLYIYRKILDYGYILNFLIYKKNVLEYL